MCDIPLNPSHFEKSDDVDRRPHASECVEDDDDICSAAFARRWRGFVVVVHRTFAILAQERAIFFLHVFELCFMLSSFLRHLEAAEALLPFLVVPERLCLQTVSSPLRHHASLCLTLWQVDILRRYLFDLWCEQARDKALDHFFNTVFASDSDSS